MAKAVKSEPKYTVTLTLDSDEAEVLFFILRNIGGSPRNSPRGEAASIHDALGDLGIPLKTYSTMPGRSEITFLDSP